MSDFAEEYTKVAAGLTKTSMELVSVLNARGQFGAATTVAELADRTNDALKAAAMVAEVYLR